MWKNEILKVTFNISFFHINLLKKLKKHILKLISQKIYVITALITQANIKSILKKIEIHILIRYIRF